MTTTAPQSARVDVLTAEVRVLQVGSRQVTLSVYRQLDAQWVTDKFEAFGRVRDGKPEGGLIQLVGRDTETGALVRHDARPTDWEPWEGPGEFTHWLRHRPKGERLSTPYRVAKAGNRVVTWTGNSQFHRCSSSLRWHVDDAEAPQQVILWAKSENDRQHDWAERERQERCTVNLAELEQTWRVQAEADLAELLESQTEYDRFKALPLIVLAGLK